MSDFTDDLDFYDEWYGEWGDYYGYGGYDLVPSAGWAAPEVKRAKPTDFPLLSNE